MGKNFQMTIKFTDAVKYDKGLPHQKKAWEFLQASVHKEILEEFARLYRNEQINPNIDGLPESGVAIIKEFEGCHLNAYYDPLTGGLPITIGWGTTRKLNGMPFLIREKISQHEADVLLYHQLKKEYLPPLTKIPYWNEMSENQKGALLSFAYNLGANFYGSDGFSTITTVLKNREWNRVPDVLYMYRNPGTRVEAGLARRRKAEGDLWKK